MNHQELRTLYNMLRQFQIEESAVTGVSSEIYKACDKLLMALGPRVRNQNLEQER